jgi:uncharacterized protein YcaQ
VTVDLSAAEARRLALWCQGLIGAAARRRDPSGVLREVGAVQLDTISVLARSHELVPYARVGPVGRAAVEAAFWGHPPRAFEYWAHAACVLPIERWPWFAFRRRSARQRLWRKEAPESAQKEVLRRLHDLGPVTTAELGGAKAGGTWWSWSPLKIAVERLLSVGEVVCVERRGWRRVYDLAERAIPAELRGPEPTDTECIRALVADAATRLGVATAADLAVYYRLGVTQVQRVAEDAGLLPARVAGWPAPAWADPAAIGALSEGRVRGRHRTTLLSPFDSLVWDRNRTERLFGFTHRLEAYVPAAKRVHGYFVMPLLAGGQLVGRVDPARERVRSGSPVGSPAGSRLVARRVALTGAAAVPAAASALQEAAAWVGAGEVVVPEGAVAPSGLAGALRRALRR